MRSPATPPRRPALLEVTKSSERGACSESMAMTNSPVSLPRQQPIKVSADGCFSSPKPKSEPLPLAGNRENLAPPPCPPATWASPSWTPGTPLLKTPTTNRMPVVKEEAEPATVGDAASKAAGPQSHLAGFQVALGLEAAELAAAEEGSASEEDVSYMPAWIASSPVPAPGLEPADDAPLPGFGRWGSPKIRNTFLQFESPLRTISVQTPPKSVPSYFAPVGCGHEPGPLGRLIDASPAPVAAASGAEPPPCEAAAPTEEPPRAEPARRPPREDVLRLKLDDFLAPGPAAQQPQQPQQPQQGDFQQAMSMEDQMQMMQWICSVGMNQMQTDQSMGAAGFLPQADGKACGMQAQACMGSGQVFAPQDYIGQLTVNPSAVPPVTDVSTTQFVPSGTFDVGAGAFQMPFMPPQAPPPPLQPLPALFAQPAQAQAAGTVLQQAPAQQPTQPQPPQAPQQLQQMAMHIQKLLQIQQPPQPAVPVAQPPGAQMPQMMSAPDAAVLAAAFPAPAGVDGPGTAPAAAAVRGPAATSAFAPGPSGARWADEQEAMAAPMALPPFPVPMFPPAAEAGAAAQPPAGRISISVGHFPEPGASTTVVGASLVQ